MLKFYTLKKSIRNYLKNIAVFFEIIELILKLKKLFK